MGGFDGFSRIVGAYPVFIGSITPIDIVVYLFVFRIRGGKFKGIIGFRFTECWAIDCWFVW